LLQLIPVSRSRFYGAGGALSSPVGRWLRIRTDSCHAQSTIP
jgi:hypothetical protein